MSFSRFKTPDLNFSGERKDAPVTRERAATRSVFGSLVGLTRCQSSPFSSAAPPTDAQRQQQQQQLSTDDDIQSTCGSSAAIGEKKRERENLASSNSEWGWEKETESERRGCGVNGKTAAARSSSEDCLIDYCKVIFTQFRHVIVR